MAKQHILDRLYDVLQDRKDADPKDSYVASLYKKGAKKITKKIGEEATELVIDAVRLEEKPKSEKRRERVKNEAADLLFHVLVLLSYQDIEPKEVLELLEERFGTSGHTEKSKRTS